jgi:hypothetical protein
MKLEEIDLILFKQMTIMNGKQLTISKNVQVEINNSNYI